MIAKRLSGAQSAMMREIAAQAGNFRGVCPLILIFRGRAAAPLCGFQTLGSARKKSMLHQFQTACAACAAASGAKGRLPFLN